MEFADLHFIAEQQIPRHSDSLLPSPRRKLSPKEAEGQVQGDRAHVQAEAQSTLLGLLSTPSTSSGLFQSLSKCLQSSLLVSLKW